MTQPHTFESTVQVGLPFAAPVAAPVYSTTKECTNCGEDLPFEEFWAHPKAPDGMHYWCKECFPKVVGEAKRLRKALLDQGYKTCGHCDKTKPVAEFGRHARTIDQLRSSCKECESHARAAARARQSES